MKPCIILPLLCSIFLCYACHAKRTESVHQNGINLHAIDGCMRAGLVVTPLNVCQSKRCTCGQDTCTEGFRCVDHQTCRCSNPDGCMCGEQEVDWGTDCKNDVPYCGNLKQTKPYTRCRYRTSRASNYYYMPQSAFWDED